MPATHRRIDIAIAVSAFCVMLVSAIKVASKAWSEELMKNEYSSVRKVMIALLVGGVVSVAMTSESQARILFSNSCEESFSIFDPTKLFDSGAWFEKPWYCYVLPY